MTKDEGMISATPAVNTRRLKRIFKKMVDTYSPAGKEEDLVNLIHGYLRRHDLPVVKQAVDEDRHNLVVEPDDVEPELVFVGHLDTVEAYDLEQYSFQQEGDEVWGLGTADMKGGCAAMVEAFTTLWEHGYANLPVALALVVGEEESGDGAQRLAREYDFSTAVVGEPTDLRPCLSHHGYLEMQLLTQGRRMHASLAPKGQNAVTEMLHLLLEVIQHLEEKRPEAVYNVRDLMSSKSGFAVPDRCEAWLDLHVPALSPLGEITFEMEELVERMTRDREDCDASVNFTTIHSGYQIPERGQFVDSLKRVLQKHQLPFEPQSFPSHSDANLLWAAGIKPILLGPGKLEKAHAADESTSLMQVNRAAQLYVDLALAYFTEDGKPPKPQT